MQDPGRRSCLACPGLYPFLAFGLLAPETRPALGWGADRDFCFAAVKLLGSTGTRLRMGMEPGSNFSFKVSIAAALRAMLTIFVGQPSIDEGEAGRPPARNGPWPPKHRRVRNETAQGNALGQCKPMDMSTESAAPSAFGHI